MTGIRENQEFIETLPLLLDTVLRLLESGDIAAAQYMLINTKEQAEALKPQKKTNAA